MHEFHFFVPNLDNNWVKKNKKMEAAGENLRFYVLLLSKSFYSSARVYGDHGLRRRQKS